MENGNAAQESPKGSWNCKADQRLFIALQRILLDCFTLLSGYSKFCSILKTLHSIFYTCTRERVKFQFKKRFLAKTHLLNTFVNCALFLLHLFFLYWKLVKSLKLVSKLCVQAVYAMPCCCHCHNGTEKSVSLSPFHVQAMPFLRVWFQFFLGGGGGGVILVDKFLKALCLRYKWCNNNF